MLKQIIEQILYIRDKTNAIQLCYFFTITKWGYCTIDCKDVYDHGIKKSGEYHINPKNDMALKVFCDMETDGGGWTVIQRRIDDKINFQRNWNDCKHGFGDLTGNFWIGLENMHILAGPSKGATLRIELKHWLKGNTTFLAKYGTFMIADESDGYRLNVADYSGNAGDAFNLVQSDRITNGMKFTTFDRDNDLFLRNCAIDFKGGWWFRACHFSHLNALYPKSPITSNSYMSWRTIDNNHGNINFSEMKIRQQ